MTCDRLAEVTGGSGVHSAWSPLASACCVASESLCILCYLIVLQEALILLPLPHPLQLTHPSPSGQSSQPPTLLLSSRGAPVFTMGRRELDLCGRQALLMLASYGIRGGPLKPSQTCGMHQPSRTRAERRAPSSVARIAFLTSPCHRVTLLHTLSLQSPECLEATLSSITIISCILAVKEKTRQKCQSTYSKSHN